MEASPAMIANGYLRMAVVLVGLRDFGAAIYARDRVLAEDADCRVSQSLRFLPLHAVQPFCFLAFCKDLRFCRGFFRC